MIAILDNEQIDAPLGVPAEWVISMSYDLPAAFRRPRRLDRLGLSLAILVNVDDFGSVFFLAFCVLHVY